jgi:hypothetical protein
LILDDPLLPHDRRPHRRWNFCIHSVLPVVQLCAREFGSLHHVKQWRIGCGRRQKNAGGGLIPSRHTLIFTLTNKPLIVNFIIFYFIKKINKTIYDKIHHSTRLFS